MIDRATGIPRRLILVASIGAAVLAFASVAAVARSDDHGGITFEPAKARVGDVITFHGDFTRPIHRVFVGCRRPYLANEPCDNVTVWQKVDDQTLLVTIPVGAHDGRALVKFVGDRVDSSKKSLKII